MSRYDKPLWREISTILFRDWDPIGVSDDSECPDTEYESYVGGVYRLVTLGGDVNELAQHLGRIETEQIELEKPDREERCRRVAQKLLALKP